MLAPESLTLGLEATAAAGAAAREHAPSNTTLSPRAAFMSGRCNLLWIVAAACLAPVEHDHHAALGHGVGDRSGIGILALPGDLALARHRRPGAVFGPAHLVGGNRIVRAGAFLV